MGDRRKKHHRLDDSLSSTLSSSLLESDRPSCWRWHCREKEQRRRNEEKDERRRKKRDKERKKKKRRHDDSDESYSLEEEEDEPRVQPQTMIIEMMREFPNVGNDLNQGDWPCNAIN